MASKPSIGIYFTDDYIEVSEISSDLKRLVRFNQTPLPTGLIVNGEIRDPARLSQVLIRMLSETQPSPISAGMDVVVGISDSRVFLREFTLPKLAGRDVDEAIDWQVKSLLPVLPGEVETDRIIIGKDVSGLIEVLLAAIPKNIIKAYMGLVRGIGLNLVSVEPAVFSNIRIIDPGQLKGKNQLMVFLGDGATEFIYLTNGNPRLSDFLTEQDIESKGGILTSVREYVKFANSKHPERPVQELLVSGFSSTIVEIANRLQETKLPVVMAKSRLTPDAQNHNLLHTSHGLSMKTAVSELSVNLLPADFRLEEVRGGVLGVWRVVLSLLSALTVLGAVAMIFLWQSSNVRLDNLKSLNQQYRAELVASSSAELIRRTEEINKLTDRLILLRGATGGEDGLLRELQNTTPLGIALTSFVYSRNLGGARLIDKTSTWLITGNANSRQLVLDFYDSLLRLSDFSNGVLYFGSLEKETGITFRIASQARL